MLIRNWMATKVITVSPGASMRAASRLLQDHKIRRLPVVDDDGKLVGIVSDRDLKAASPSKATTLDAHELYYLLSEIKIKDIMTRNPIAMRGDNSVEEAAIIMVEKHFGGIPVVDDENRVIGIITDTDIFKVFINITGAQAGGLQLAFELSIEEGSLRNALNALREHSARVVSVLTSQSSQERRMVYIRVRHMEEGRQNALISDMRERFRLLYWKHRN